MANKSYVGDIKTVITLDCGCTISGSTTHTIEVKKPDGEEVSWPASIAGQTLQTETELGDFDMPGTYYLQAYIELDGGVWSGETGTITVYDAYK